MQDLLQGTLYLLVWKAMAPGELHGLGISRRIEQNTLGTFLVKPGSLFPALHRREWLVSTWGESRNNRKAKYNKLTRAGRAQLGTEKSEWERIAGGIRSALEAQEG